MRVRDDIGGLPELLLDAMQWTGGPEEFLQPYDIRVTDLIDSPRIKLLKQRHFRELEADASGQIFAFLGQAFHAFIEERAKLAANARYLSEKRLYAKFRKIVITGKVDLQVPEEGKVFLIDWKLTSAWGVQYRMSSWTAQLNCYAFLFYKTYGFWPAGLIIVSLYRDWSAWEARTRTGYPQKALEKHEIKLWPPEEIERYLNERVELHLSGWANSELDEWPLCSDADRWLDQKFFVRSRFRKTAIATCATREEAERVIESKKSTVGLYIAESKATPRRCKGNYCHVAQFCDQYQNEIKGEEVNNGELSFDITDTTTAPEAT